MCVCVCVCMCLSVILLNITSRSDTWLKFDESVARLLKLYFIYIID